MDEYWYAQRLVDFPVNVCIKINTILMVSSSTICIVMYSYGHELPQANYNH